MPSIQERFDELYIPEPNSGCWIWTGSIKRNGYGRFHLSRRGFPELAHRVSWMLSHNEKELPCGCVLHTCDNPSCVNPAHLWLGSHRDNTRDMISKGRKGNSPARGERCSKAKLTEKIVKAIRKDRRTISAIAADYGVSQSCIYRVKSSETWSHIIGE